jgi:glycosyltransferase involved in cell wall biosynthesis
MAETDLAPEISVVLITYNRAAQLRVALNSLLAQSVRPGWPFEIIVVDDGSTDETPAVLAQIAAGSAVPLRALRTEGIGVPAARNLGARNARGRWIASFDDDQIASARWLDAFCDAAEQTHGTCFGGALLLLLPAEEAPRCRELGPRARGLLGEHTPSCQLSPYPHKWLPASNNYMVQRSVFEKAGGYDESFAQGGSDTDFFRRIEQCGETIWFVPAASGQHVIPPTRLRDSYFRWAALKVGAAWMRIQRKEGRAHMLRMAIFRLGSLGRDLPLLAKSFLARDRAAALDIRCSLWYTEGVLKGLLAHSIAHARSSKFLNYLDFRYHHGDRIQPPHPR